jgi:hypothetical protein
MYASYYREIRTTGARRGPHPHARKESTYPRLLGSHRPAQKQPQNRLQGPKKAYSTERLNIVRPRSLIKSALHSAVSADCTMAYESHPTQNRTVLDLQPVSDLECDRNVPKPRFRGQYTRFAIAQACRNPWPAGSSSLLRLLMFAAYP